MEENCRSLTQEQAVQIGLEMFGLLAARCLLLFKEHIASQDLGVKFLFITARKRSLGQGNIFIGVCQEFCSQGGVSASVHAGMPPPSRHHPPWEQTPPPGTMYPPGTTYPPQDYVPPRYYVPPLGLHTPPDYVPPRLRTPPAQSMCGRHASYWNAFLFKYAKILFQVQLL